MAFAEVLPFKGPRVPVPASVGPVVASVAPTTCVAFGQTREVATGVVVSASPGKRACLAQEMTWVQQDGDREVMAAPKCVEAVAKRTQQQARKSAASAAKREDRVLRSCLQPALDQKDAPPRLAGILLALPKEDRVRHKAQRLGFKQV